jgi:hypothetical protein
MSLLRELFIRIKGDTKDYNKKVDGVDKKTNSLTKNIAKYGMAIKGAFLAAAVAVVAFAKKAMEAYDQQVKAEASLTAALGGREDMMRRIAMTASDLQKRTLFGDEKSIEAASRLAQNIGANEKAIKQLLPLVADFASAKGMDMATTADLVGKTLASSTNLLSRYGLQIEGAVGSTERLESATRALEKAFGGQAEAAAKAGLGPLTQLKNIIGDYTEELGKAIVKSEQWAKTIEMAAKWMEVAQLAAIGISGQAEADAIRFSSEWRDASETAEEYIDKVATAQVHFRKKIAETNAELKKTINPFKRKELKNDLEYFTVIIDELTKSVRGVFDDFGGGGGGIVEELGLIAAKEKEIADLTESIPSITDRLELAKANDQLKKLNEELETLKSLTTFKPEQINIAPIEAIAPAMLAVADATDAATESLDRWAANWKETVLPEVQAVIENLDLLIQDFIVDSLGTLAESFGAALATGDWQSALDKMLIMVADWAGYFGKLLIAAGLASQAFMKSLATNPGIAIAAGIALVAAAGLVKGALSKNPMKGSGGGGGSSSVASSAGQGDFFEGFRFLQPDLQVSVTGELVGRGSDLVTVINNEGRRRNF